MAVAQSHDKVTLTKSPKLNPLLCEPQCFDLYLILLCLGKARHARTVHCFSLLSNVGNLALATAVSCFLNF
jgi:hypothetical protein